MTATAEHHLLFGLLALQNGLIDQVQLVAAFQAWTRDKSKSLADHLEARGDLTGANRALLEALAKAHMDAHGGNAERSLASIPIGRSTREILGRLGDPEIGGSLGHVGSARGSLEDGDVDRTTSYAVGSATSDGQRFRILRPHARGGLGAVFVALDGELHREVALKQILDSHADDPASRQRFLVEAEITGGLEHPGVVPVYGLGAYSDGRPYYTMRFIKGDSLKEAIERFHADDELKIDPARRSLALRKLLRRFTDVCNAIDYAHSRGVLHRDIKPGNVVVGKYGETLVVDWGLAKAVGRADPTSSERTLVPRSASGSAETLPGSVLGTPAYMSPEQAAGDLEQKGPRSDVYSLGATLYCLLTGRPPFEGDAGDVLRAVQQGEFPPPRKLDPSIDQALEAVCLKAMAAKPEDRYASCRALADDIERWTADEPVTAWREPFSRRARRWAIRNRTAVTALAASVLVALAGTAAVLAVQRHANGRLRQANSALVNTKQRVTLALQHNRNALYSQRNISVLIFQRLRDIAGTQDLREELLRTSVKGLHDTMEIMDQLGAVGAQDEQGAATDKEAAATATRTLAGLYQRAGVLMEDFGRYDEAIRYYRQMDELAESLAADNPGQIDARRPLASSKITIGLFEMNRLGDAKAALGHLEQNLALRREFLAHAPRDDEAKRGVCNALGLLARVWLKLGDPIKASLDYKKEIALRNQIGAKIAGEVEFRRESAGLEEKLGDLYVALNDNSAGREHYDRALKIREEIARHNPGHNQAQRDLPLSYNKLGTFYLLQLKDPAAARVYYEKTLAEFERRLQAEPQNVVAKEDLALTHYYVATAALRAGDSKAADEHYRACLAIREALAGDPKAKLNIIDLMIARARCGQHQVASNSAEELIKGPPLDARVYFQAACGFSLCAGAVAEEAASPEAKALAGRYTQSAFKALRLALGAGWKNLVDFQTDPDLDAVRDSPGFEAIVAEYRKANGK